MPSALEHLDKHRSRVHTRSGPASCIDTGGPGRAALFVHGAGGSSYLWRHVIGQLGGQRRCVAFDLPLHGQTPATADQDFSLPGLARLSYLMALLQRLRRRTGLSARTRSRR
jgi:pimeloyl-ACP methyl ester carboxylesterase